MKKEDKYFIFSVQLYRRGMISYLEAWKRLHDCNNEKIERYLFLSHMPANILDKKRRKELLYLEKKFGK